MSKQHDGAAAFTGLVDLAAERVGGQVIFANDDFFAEKENLIKAGRGIFIDDKYTDRGKWMDGWESRRKRTPGHDFAIIRLGLAGAVYGVDIDTNHFLGNAPQFASLEGCTVSRLTPLNELDGADWREILPVSPLRPGSQNLFAINGGDRLTHVRLRIYPDGGVARLRIYGRVMPRWDRLNVDQMVDLAAIASGGRAIACSDMFFSDMNNLIMPGESINMGDGWETKRRRGPGDDWVILKLGSRGRIYELEISTRHFKGNYPDSCEVEYCDWAEANPIDLLSDQVQWRPLLERTKLQADNNEKYKEALADNPKATHLRLRIFPDGGIARLRAWGRPIV